MRQSFCTSPSYCHESRHRQKLIGWVLTEDPGRDTHSFPAAFLLLAKTLSLTSSSTHLPQTFSENHPFWSIAFCLLRKAKLPAAWAEAVRAPLLCLPPEGKPVASPVWQADLSFNPHPQHKLPKVRWGTPKALSFPQRPCLVEFSISSLIRSFTIAFQRKSP